MTMWRASGGRSIRPPFRRVRGSFAVLAATLIAFLGTAPPAVADEIRDRQWHLDFLNVAEAHQITRGQGVTVAVVDTGVQADHPDLRGNVLPGTDFDTGGDGRTDEHGHGTKMASLIAGHGHGSDDGALGIAPDAKILPVGVEQLAEIKQIAQGVRWAADHGAQVINISLAVSEDESTLREAVAYAQSHDIVVVGGAGNTFDGDYIVGHPAAYSGVIGVSAIDRSGEFTGKVSVRGQEIDLASPGKDIVTATNRDGYAISMGTSDSAAIVSGVAALVRARYPDLDAANVINRLVKTADDKGPEGRDPQYGLGVVNPVEALTADVPSVTENPLGTLADEPAPPASSPADTSAPTDQAAPGGDGGGNALLIAIIIAVVAAAVAAAIAIVVINRSRRRPTTMTPAGPGGPAKPGGPGPSHQPPPGYGPYPPPGQPPDGPPPGGPPLRPPSDQR